MCTHTSNTRWTFPTTRTLLYTFGFERPLRPDVAPHLRVRVMPPDDHAVPIYGSNASVGSNASGDGRRQSASAPEGKTKREESVACVDDFSRGAASVACDTICLLACCFISTAPLLTICCACVVPSW